MASQRNLDLPVRKTDSQDAVKSVRATSARKESRDQAVTHKRFAQSVHVPGRTQNTPDVHDGTGTAVGGAKSKLFKPLVDHARTQCWDENETSGKVNLASSTGSIQHKTGGTTGTAKTCALKLTCQYLVQNVKKSFFTEFEYEFSIESYMKWKFLLCSQLERGNLLSDNYCLHQDATFELKQPVNNTSHAEHLAKTLIGQTVDTYCKDVHVHAFYEEMKQSSIDLVNEQKDRDIYAEIIGGVFYMACLSDQKLEIMASVLDLIKKTRMSKSRQFQKEVNVQHCWLNFDAIIKEIIGKNFSNVEIEMLEQSGQSVCVLQGLREEVERAAASVIEIDKTVCRRQVETRLNETQVLLKPHVLNKAREKLRRKFDNCWLFVENGQICVVGFNVNVVLQATEFVARLITTLSTQLTGQRKMKSDDIVRLIEKKCGDTVLVEVYQLSQIHVFGLAEDIDNVKALLVELNEGRVSLETSVSNINPVNIPPADVYTFTIGNERFVKFLKEMAYLEKIAKRHNCEVRLTADNVVEIEGDEGASLEAKHDCETLMKKIDQHFIEITDRYAQDYILYSQQFVDTVATECKVNIEPIYKTSITGVDRSNFTIEKKAYSGIVTWETDYSSSKRELIVADLDENVDDHEGLHMKFIQSDPKSNKRLVKADHILTIEVPDRTKGHKSSDIPETFRSAISKGLDKMATRQIKKLVVFAQAVGGWDFSPFMKCIVIECTKWLVQSPNIYPYQVTVLVDGSDDKDITVTLVDTYILENMNNKDEVVERPLVKIVEGNLDQTKADILVNTAAPNLDLKHGRVSAALSKAAGPQLQLECTRKYPDGIDYGEVAYTKGFGLGCKSVFHVTIPHFSVQDPNLQHNLMNIRTPMMACLKLASKYQNKTIAFPAIGTGKLGYPIDVVASEMFGSIKRFRQDDPKTTLQEIYFVIYNKDTQLLNTFREFEQRSAKLSLACWQHEMRLEITGFEDGIKSARRQIDKKLQIVAGPNAEITEWFGDVPLSVCTVLFEMLYGIEAYIKKLSKFKYDKQQQCFEISGKVGTVVRVLQMLTEYTRTIKNMHQCQVSIKGIGTKSKVDIFAGIKANADQKLFYAYDGKLGVVVLFASNSEVLRAAEESIKEKLKILLTDEGGKNEGTRKGEVENEDTLEGNCEGKVDGEGRRQNVDKVRRESERKVEPGRTLVQRSFSWSQNTSNLQLYTNGTKKLLVKVYEGDLLTAPVEAIVNAANENLEHCGGIARVIAKRAGSELVKESKEIIKHLPGGNLHVSSVVTTTAGSLPYQCVLHAVGPLWSAYKPITKESLQCCETDLRNTITNCLKRANEKKLTSIALPAISAGLFAVPLEICAEQYAQAIIQYAEHGTLQEVHFVNNDSPSKIIPLIHQVFTEMITNRKSSPFTKAQYLDTSVAARNLPDAGTSMEGGNKNIKNSSRRKLPCVGDDEASKPMKMQTNAEVKTMKNTYRSKPPSVGDDEVSETMKRSTDAEITVNVCHRTEDNCLMCVITEKVTWYMLVYEADIFTIDNVDALVCGDNKQGSGKGMVASELARLGGKEYVEAKAWEFTEKNPKVSDVITTTGGRCGYRWIMHVVIPRNSVRLYDAYRNIFEEARRRRLQSIVLPLLGTGSADISPSDSALALWEEWIQYCEKYRDDLIPMKIHVVLREPTVLAEVQDLFRTYADNIEKHREAAGRADGHREAASGVSGHKDAAGGAEKLGQATGGADKYEDTTGSPVKRKETTEGAAGRREVSAGSEVKSSSIEVAMCVICMDQMDKPKRLKCGHFFCTDCIDGYFKVKKVCPTCGQVCGIVTGDQPDGTLEIKKVRRPLSGYNKEYSIALTYNFISSKQGPNHPQPGKPYKGINRTGYLPDTDEGRQICAMMKVAFERSLVFTIGTSRTTGEQGVITWNDIHHKTDPKPNTQFGYPDPSYLDRVTDELAVKGVTHEDIDKQFLKKLKDDKFKMTVDTGTRL